MTFLLRICLLAFCFVLVSPASAVMRPASLTTVADPSRYSGSVPLALGHRSARRAPSLAQRAVRIAAQEIGVRYRYGGSSPSGFDCSGLVAYVFGRLGIRLPHNAAAQYSYGRAVDRRHLEPGDLVFFHGLGHVGLYIGHGRIIHAPQTGERVEIQRLALRYMGIEGARRIL
jgi:cell wall-associated NlpC family hydrolase